MASTNIINNISRSETYPKIVAVSTSKNYGYISMDVSSWTEQMRHEIPAIQINIYTKLNSVDVRYDPVSIMLSTKENISEGIYDVPSTFYLSVQPMFDPYCIKAHNQLIQNGLEKGPDWVETDTFSVDIKFITD